MWLYSRNDFDKTLVESVDESLFSLLGESVTFALYNHFEKFYAIQRDQIPEKLDDFSMALGRTFGLPANRAIVKKVVERLYSKLGLQFQERANYAFRDYITDAKTRR